MKNVFIFHGTGGYPEENWFPWLKKELEKRNFNVIVPEFPTPKDQTPETWFKVFKKYEKFYNPETIIFGHSLGGTFLLRVLEKYDVKIKAAFFIAAAIGILPLKNIKTDKPFVEGGFKWDKIKHHAENFFVIHSDNDPFVSLKNGKELAKHLGVNLIFIPNAGHFNKAAGYTKFDKLLELVK
jgi:predicted alpha/beta hydrolase family esterase